MVAWRSGERHIWANLKYYFTDLGLRKQLEVNFVVNQASQRYYIQVAYDLTSEEKQAQEFNSLRHIPDSFKKIVIVNGARKPWRNDEGFVIMGMKYFLLNADSLEF